MRAKTKERLIAMLEADLAAVKKKLDTNSVYEHYQSLDKALNQLTAKVSKAKSQKELNELNVQIQKLTLMSEKAWKAAFPKAETISAWFDEQFKIEDELEQLKTALFYVTTDK